MCANIKLIEMYGDFHGGLERRCHRRCFLFGAQRTTSPFMKQSNSLLNVRQMNNNNVVRFCIYFFSIKKSLDEITPQAKITFVGLKTITLLNFIQFSVITF